MDRRLKEMEAAAGKATRYASKRTPGEGKLGARQMENFVEGPARYMVWGRNGRKKWQAKWQGLLVSLFRSNAQQQSVKFTQNETNETDGDKSDIDAESKAMESHLSRLQIELKYVKLYFYYVQ